MNGEINILNELMGLVPLLCILAVFVIPFGMLANNTYKAVFKKTSVPTGIAILNYIPFYNYISIRKYLYGNSLPSVIMSCLVLACAIFRALAIVLWSGTDPYMMIISVWVSLAGLGIWYLLMAFTAFYTARLTRRSWPMVIIGTIIPFFGAYIVAKNIRGYFKEMEKGSEFVTDADKVLN